MNGLAMQLAFALPMTLPLVLVSAAYRRTLFYPALMVVVGAHYLPFIFLYGMWQFGVLAALLIGSGLLIGMFLPTAMSVGGWLSALVLLVFAFIGRHAARPLEP